MQRGEDQIRKVTTDLDNGHLTVHSFICSVAHSVVNFSWFTLSHHTALVLYIHISRAVRWTALTTMENSKLWRRWVMVELRAVMSIRFGLKRWWVFRVIVIWTNEERIRKMALSLPHNFEFGCLPRAWTVFGHCMVDHKGTQKGRLGALISTFSVFVESYTTSMPSLDIESTDSNTFSNKMTVWSGLKLILAKKSIVQMISYFYTVYFPPAHILAHNIPWLTLQNSSFGT